MFVGLGYMLVFPISTRELFSVPKEVFILPLSGDPERDRGVLVKKGERDLIGFLFSF